MNLKRLSSGMPAPSGQGPATRASTSPPRSRSPQLDGMPGSPGARCPPGPPAPRTKALSDLPVEVLSLIAHKLSEGPLPEAGHDLANASMAHRALRAAVATVATVAGLDEHARRCLPLERKARQVAGSLLSGNPNATQAGLCLPVLGLLNREEQKQLVRILPDPAKHVSDGWLYSPTVFEKFVPQLENLDPRLCAELATRATLYGYDSSASQAIVGLSGGLAHLAESSIDQLLDRATRMRDEPDPDRTITLFGLSRGWAHMKPHQRQGLLQAAMSTQDGVAQRHVNAGLCAQLKHLPPGEQDRLFNWAINLPNYSKEWPTAMEGLAASAEDLDPGQKEALLTKVLDRTSYSNTQIGIGIRALAANMRHLGPDLGIRLVDWTLQHFWGGAAVESLGSGLKHMASHQQDLLLETAVRVSHRGRRDLIWDFATALPSLAPASRSKVAALMLGPDNDNDNDAVARAIGALGPHLEYLEEDQRNTVAERALRILNNHAKKLNPPEGEALGALALGMGAGIRALRENLRDALVNAVAAFAFNPHLFRDAGEPVYRAHVKTVAGVIAGLASGRHLSGPQFQTLIDAASRLEERIEQARRKGRVPPGTCDELKAMVIFGLLSAWPRPSAARTPSGRTSTSTHLPRPLPA